MLIAHRVCKFNAAHPLCKRMIWCKPLILVDQVGVPAGCQVGTVGAKLFTQGQFRGFIQVRVSSGLDDIEVEAQSVLCIPGVHLGVVRKELSCATFSRCFS